ALRETLLGADLERFRVVVDPLVEEFDVVEVALAAVKLAHEASGAADDEDEIAQPPMKRDRDTRPKRAAPGRDRRRGEAPARGMTRPFVGAGRDAGVRPQDLVGAITGESRLSGKEIGAIEIADRYALVEVPESAVQEVIAALRATTIKGKRAT